MIPPLDSIWEEQRKYNERVRDLEQTNNYEYWMKQYLLGMLSEVDEILGEINWKIHRRGRPVDKVNLARELADATKYIFSMWELSGFTATDMLLMVHAKSQELEAQWHQEMEFKLSPQSKVLITDIDGTLADYRKGFIEWITACHSEDLPTDPETNMAMEIDLGLSYPIYVRLKEQFEASGGYGTLPIYPDVALNLRLLCEQGVKVIAYTARPAQRFSRIWMDTWAWLETNGIAQYVHQLNIGKEQRIATACELVEQGHQVAMLEDDPELAIRAASAGVWVYLRDQLYNAGIKHSKVMRISKLNADRIIGLLTC